MITCAIIDDEPLAVGLLESYVAKTPFLTLCGTYGSAVEALGELKGNPVQLVFCDIQMPDLGGLDFARLMGTQTAFVFTTAFSQYAIDAYKVNAIDYLLKPISYPDFLAAATKAQHWLDHAAKAAPASAGEDCIYVKSEYKILRISTPDILYVEGLKDYVKIHLATAPRPLLTLTSMKTIEDALPPTRFFRIHRSFIVNMARVDVVERGQIVFGETRLPVSDSYRDRVQAYIQQRLISR